MALSPYTLRKLEAGDRHNRYPTKLLVIHTDSRRLIWDMSSILTALTRLITDDDDQNEWSWADHGRCLVDRTNAISVQFLLNGVTQTIRYPLNFHNNTYKFGVSTSEDRSLMHLWRISIEEQGGTELILSAPASDQSIYLSIVDSRKPCQAPTRVTEIELGSGDSVSINIAEGSRPGAHHGLGIVLGQAARRQAYYINQYRSLHPVDNSTRRR